MVEYPKTIEETFRDRNSYSFDTMPGSFVDAMMNEPRFPPSARFRQAKWVTHESGIT